MRERTVSVYIRSLVLVALSVLLTVNLSAQSHSQADNLLAVGDTVVKRIMPKPISDSSYVATDYTEIHFRLNNAKLDISYMDNGLSMLHLDRVIDSIGKENIVAIEIISQSSPEGTLERNQWLTKNRSEVMLYYMYRVFPDLKDKISLNTITESWENLAQYVAQDPNLEQTTIDKILNIIDSEELSINAKKSKLKNSLGKDPKTGDVYAYISKYYFPVIRNSGIYVLHSLEPVNVLDMDVEIPLVEEKSPTIDDTIRKQPESQPIIEPVAFRKRPLLAVKTNIPYYGFAMKDLGWAPIYNIEAELYPTEHGRWTLLAEYEFPWHTVLSKHQYFQILNFQIEGRRYFKRESNHTGHYLSAYIGSNLFDICFDEKAGHGYQGEGFGGGLGYGYVMPLGKNPDTRWKLEFLVKGGVYMTFYDPYDAGSPFAGKYYYSWFDEPRLFIRRNMIFRWLGPTGVGISLSYDLIRKKVSNK